MSELIVVMLLIISWHPEKPGEIGLERPEIVFESTEACEAEGAKIAARMTEAAKEQSGAMYQHRCMNVPSGEEFDQLFERLDKSAK